MPLHGSSYVDGAVADPPCNPPQFSYTFLKSAETEWMGKVE